MVEITPDSFPSTTSAEDQVAVTAIPKDHLVTSTHLTVSTAFVAGTDFKVGTSSDDDALMTTVQAGPTVGLKTGNAGLNTLGNQNEETVFVEMSWSGTKSTTGVAHLVIWVVGLAPNAGDPSLVEINAGPVS